VNDIGDIFYDQETQEAVDRYNRVAETWKETLNTSPNNEPVDLPSRGFGGPLRGLAIRLRQPVELAHSGWLYRHISDAAPGQDVSKLVGLATTGHFTRLRQFSAVGASGRLYIVATGPHADALLRAAIDAERRFDANMFDSDGYLKG
jgi:hypothetical protein